MNMTQALATFAVGQWYGDGQCYAHVGQYIYLLTGKDISYSNGHPMHTLIGAGSHAWYIAEDWDWSGYDFEIIIEPTNTSNVKVGDIVCIAGYQGAPWYTLSQYGHTAVVNRIEGNTIYTHNQNYGTNGGGGPIVELAMSRSNFIDGIHSIIRPGSKYGGSGSGAQGSPSTSTSNADVNKIGGNSQANQSQSVNYEKLLTDIKNTLNKFLEEIQGNLYGNTISYTNQIVNLIKVGTLQNLSINTDEIDKLISKISNAINKLKEQSTNNTSASTNDGKQSTSDPSTSSIYSDGESTVEDRVRMIAKICKEFCPSANAYGVAGMIGNFVAESGIDPTNFEARTYCTIKDPYEVEKPTAEHLFDSWGSFAGLYNISLNERAYLGSDGLHWIGLGLGQWTGPRAEALYNFAKSKGQKFTTVKLQMEFAFSSAEGGNATILKQCLTNSESVREGVYNFYTYWERATVASSESARVAGAEKWYPLVKSIIG